MAERPRGGWGEDQLGLKHVSLLFIYGNQLKNNSICCAEAECIVYCNKNMKTRFLGTIIRVNLEVYVSVLKVHRHGAVKSREARRSHEQDIQLNLSREFVK